MISVITVNWNSYEWLDLLISSLEIFSSEKYDLVVTDNSVSKLTVERAHVHIIPQAINIGHGRGLNVAVEYANHLPHPYMMFLDVDCHFIRPGWEEAFCSLMKEYDVVAGNGVPQKPIRPACMFMKKEFSGYDWSPTPGYRGHRITPDGFDTAIKAYYGMINDGVRIGLLSSLPGHYGTLNGEEWCVDGVPYLYHHWHGTHLIERSVDFPGKDLLADKALLFSRIPWRQI